ncbi:MAG TPA: DUF2206 domain-containing protein [Candidatus Saccharimonadales bacterium]|nr:DUF2206 domain-containing protein [Candidatus Saccharimonadales bacterium]
MIIRLRCLPFIGAIAAWWALIVLMSALQWNEWQLLNILGFSFLTVVPGALIVHLLRLDGMNIWGKLGLSVGLSILSIMSVALLGNTILPYFGIDRPLDRPVLLAELSVFIYVLLATALYRWLPWQYMKLTIRRYGPFESWHDALLALFPLTFVGMSILGANSLNNGGSNLITFSMLASMGAYSGLLVYYAKRVGANVLPTAIFLMGLSLLLMTSLRGWYVTGHDIQREYRVFELTKHNGVWDIGSFRDAYNACMSITALPTVFDNILKIADPYVYKVLFQLIFAVVPAMVYLIVRRYASAAIAFLSALYFMAFPTFFGDMPMLNRQEIAFLFLALMLYILFHNRIALRLRQVLFVLLGIGMVLSHYSTTYMVIAVLLFAVVARPLFAALARRLSRRKLFKQSAVAALRQDRLHGRPHLTVIMVVVLAVASFVWSGVLTDTSGNSISRVVGQTLAVMRNTAEEDARSGDVHYSVFSWQKVDLDNELRSYEKRVVSPARDRAAEDTYYDPATYEKYGIKATGDTKMPLTPLGSALDKAGVDVASFNYLFRQFSARLLQVLIIIGFIYLLFRARHTKIFDTEFMLLAAGSLLLVLSQVVLPVLSIEYGLLRAFQQSLIFLGMFVVIGSLVMMVKVKETAKLALTTGIAIVFMLSSTGVFTQALGGYYPQLHLNNAGTYYDIYYLHSSEVRGIDWLAQQLKKETLQQEYQSEVQTDRYSFNKVRSIRQINLLNDIYPSLVRQGSYVYLGHANVTKHQATLSYKGNLITYAYPIQFLDEQKDLLYSNGGSRVYR